MIQLSWGRIPPENLQEILYLLDYVFLFTNFPNNELYS